MNLQMVKLHYIKTHSLQRFVAPVNLSCKMLKNYCTESLINYNINKIVMIELL